MNTEKINSGFIKTVYSFLIIFLISVINVSAQGTNTPTPFIDLQYGYDPSGNVTSVINHIDPENTAFMDYDSLDRLIRSSGPWGEASYRYDSSGNRTEKQINDELFNYGYKGANNNLDSVVHDRNGNVIADDKYRYTYDSQNRLTEIWSGDDLIAAYQYDAFGRRISKTDRDGNTTYYAYGRGLNVLTEFSQDGVPESDYVYAGKSRIAKIDFDIIGSPESTYFYHANHLGSNISVTDRITDEIWDNDYLPFGSSLNTDNESITEIQHQYSSKELDEDTGLYYFGARYYNPETGRFMSVDPAGIDITNPQSWNRYAYVQNNPYTYVDPDGRAAEVVWDAFNIGLGVHSLKQNLTKGNYADALIDAAGVSADLAAAAIPFVPGGAGSVIKASRAGGVVSDFDQYEGVRVLSKKLKAAGLSRKSRLDIIQSFKRGTIKVNRASGEENFIRYYGGDANEYGRYLSKSFPAYGSARTKFALPPNNPADKLTQFKLKSGSTYFEGTVAPNFKKPGGDTQIFVPNLEDLIKP